MNESRVDRELLVLVATYNEIENLPSLIDAILAAVPSADVLVIDDGSPDGTGVWCDQRCAVEPRLSVVHRTGKLGLGSATIRGMREAIDRGYRLVATMDADFSHPPDRLPDLIEPLRGESKTDVVVGSRYVPGGRIEGWPWTRRWMSRWINRFARWVLWLPVRDCSGAFRVYRTELLERLPPESLRAQGYAYLEEILFRLVRTGARIREVPFVFRDRIKGQTKINWREAVAALWTIVKLGVLRR
ncbi:MAG: polyprenol monophosphomannose synthase [Pirellulaceae bacterium]